MSRSSGITANRHDSRARSTSSAVPFCKMYSALRIVSRETLAALAISSSVWIARIGFSDFCKPVFLSPPPAEQFSFALACTIGFNLSASSDRWNGSRFRLPNHIVKARLLAKTGGLCYTIYFTIKLKACSGTERETIILCL